LAENIIFSPLSVSCSFPHGQQEAALVASVWSPYKWGCNMREHLKDVKRIHDNEDFWT